MQCCQTILSKGKTKHDSLLGTLRSDDGDGGKERQKSNRFCNQNNTFARASRFFEDFFAVTARLRRENAQFHVVQRTYTSEDEISSLYLNLDMVLRNSTLEGSTCIWQSWWLGVIAMNIERTRIYFFSDCAVERHEVVEGSFLGSKILFTV